MTSGFTDFILRHRIRLAEITGHRPLTLQDYELAKHFSGWELLSFTEKREELERLGFAMAIAGYVAECATDEPKLFSQIASDLRDDEWRYVLRFCPYHKVDTALKNLDVIQSALEDACLALNAARAGMETAFDHSRDEHVTYRREQSKATAQLLNFSALYASYVDVCRRIRGYCQLTGEGSYDRAVRRLVAKNASAHSFAKDLRNYSLHYHIPEPNVTIRISDHRSVTLWLDSQALLYSGFKWKSASRTFLQASKELDVMETVTAITKDVIRTVRFHRKLVDVRLVSMQFAYNTYQNERARYQQLRNSVTDIGAAFKRPRSLMSRLLEKDFVDQVLASSLPDQSARRLLIDFADRHQNLPKEVLESLEKEIERALSRRPNFPTGGAYLSRRKIE